jgi:hypothetical protein
MKRMMMLVVLLAALVVFAGCTEPEAEAGAPVTDHETLADALGAAGLDASEHTGEGADLSDPLFDGTPRALMAGEAMIQTFEFASEAEAEEAAATVNPTGNIIGTKTVDWVEPPHFYRQGKLIVLYAGSDEAVLSALEAALGEPFAVGDGMFILPDES